MKILIITLAIISLFHLNIYAQQSEQDTIKKYRLEEIVIKSPKYNKDIFEIPAAFDGLRPAD